MPLVIPVLAQLLDEFIINGGVYGRNTQGSNRAFSHDVTAAILVFQNNETAAMLVYQTNRPFPIY